MSIFSKLIDAIANAVVAVFGESFHRGGVINQDSRERMIDLGHEYVVPAAVLFARQMAARGIEKVVDKRGREIYRDIFTKKIVSRASVVAPID
jgi:hypothetical protein